MFERTLTKNLPENASKVFFFFIWNLIFLLLPIWPVLPVSANSLSSCVIGFDSLIMYTGSEEPSCLIDTTLYFSDRCLLVLLIILVNEKYIGSRCTLPSFSSKSWPSLASQFVFDIRNSVGSGLLAVIIGLF